MIPLHENIDNYKLPGGLFVTECKPQKTALPPALLIVANKLLNASFNKAVLLDDRKVVPPTSIIKK